jgi:diguanylate cyclase (GGDEF)-like protein/PAS domain S-box-containing protein
MENRTPDKKPVVLIVDDEITARLLTREALEQSDFVVHEAEDGNQALAAVPSVKPDIIVTDVMMPGMDGFALCKEIRRHEQTRLLPVLIVTGLDDIRSIHRAYEVGATDFITKPFSWLVLRQRIRHILRESRLVDELSRSEAKNRALLSAIPDTMFRADRRGVLLEVKESRGFDFVEFSDPLEGKTLYEVMPIGVAQTLVAAMEQVHQAGTTETVEYQLMLKGALRTFEARIVGNGETETLTIVRDITERKRAENALRESEERYALALQGANDGLWDWDIRAMEIHYSSRWKSMLGYENHEIHNSPDEWFGRIHPEDVEQLKVLLHAHLEGVSDHFESEHRMLHRDGTHIWVLTRGIAVLNKSGKAQRMAGSMSDITDRKRAQEQLLRNALYDPLTALPNRTLLINRLEQALAKTKRSQDYMFAVLFLDLDRFKSVNDTFGHGCGDQVLAYVARRLETCIRPGDTVSRIGGDEFAVLLDNISTPLVATKVAERIEKSLASSVEMDGKEIFMPASIGIALGEYGCEKPEDVLRDADIAVYRAKALGRGRHVVFDHAMYQQTVGLLELENDLRGAVERKEFFLHYQPVVSLDSCKLVYLEALIRWQHPQRGVVHPTEFIPLAEETGLIISIGEWVLRKVCEQLTLWKKSNDPCPVIAVNISIHQLRKTGFAGVVKAILEEYDIPSDRLEFEITESVLMENLEEVNAALSELCRMGLHLSLDDFGTGYSSLNYLQRFPVQKLKVDQSFIANLTSDSDTPQIVKAILQMARGLGLEVVAEGVETDEAASQLKEMGCELAQGYFFARPMDVASLPSLDHVSPASHISSPDDSKVTGQQPAGREPVPGGITTAPERDAGDHAQAVSPRTSLDKRKRKV